MIIIFPETSRLSSFFARPRRGEFAYATNQGQHNVIDKFRNSAIMCEYPGYRPSPRRGAWSSARPRRRLLFSMFSPLSPQVSQAEIASGVYVSCLLTTISREACRIRHVYAEMRWRLRASPSLFTVHLHHLAVRRNCLSGGLELCSPSPGPPVLFPRRLPVSLHR